MTTYLHLGAADELDGVDGDAAFADDDGDAVLRAHEQLSALPALHVAVLLLHQRADLVLHHAHRFRHTLRGAHLQQPPHTHQKRGSHATGVE
jgi:hypothetical protein